MFGIQTDNGKHLSFEQQKEITVKSLNIKWLCFSFYHKSFHAMIAKEYFSLFEAIKVLIYICGNAWTVWCLPTYKSAKAFEIIRVVFKKNELKRK